MTGPTDPRTYLFVPGNRPERFAKALASGADAVVLDLEDAVAADDKDAARDAVARWCRRRDDPPTAPASSCASTTLGSTPSPSDLRRCGRGAGSPRSCCPRPSRPRRSRAVRAAVPDAAVLALIESARGVAAAEEIAAARRASSGSSSARSTTRSTSTSTSPTPRTASPYAAGALALASRVAGLATPVAGVTPQLDDEQRLLADLAWSRRHGFGAKLCIHPRQVAPIHAALRPDARRPSTGPGACSPPRPRSPGAAQLDGRMIDRPVVLQAQRTLQRAPRLTPHFLTNGDPPCHPPSSTPPSSRASSPATRCATSGPTRTAPRSTSTSRPRWPRCRAGSA